jgi:hypothetical protein
MTTAFSDWFVLNTGTRVSVDRPDDNPFSHTVEGGAVFYFAIPVGGKMSALKVVVSYGDSHEPYDVVYPVSQGRNGDRALPPHQVIAKLNKTGIHGKVEKIVAHTRNVPLYVMK